MIFLKILGLVFVFLNLNFTIKCEKNVYIVTTQRYMNNKLFDFVGYGKIREMLKQKGFNISTLDNPKSLSDKDIVVFIDSCWKNYFKWVTKLPKDNLILFVFEPCTVVPDNFSNEVHEKFGKIYTWDDNFINNTKYFKVFYPKLRPFFKNNISFESKKLCVMIARQRSFVDHPQDLIKERSKVIQSFENCEEGIFDLYGLNWPKNISKNYNGEIEDRNNNCPLEFYFLNDFNEKIPPKIQILQKYKFCICYENTFGMKGYVTEKIFDCFAAGCVPIYWGASNIQDFIPPNCFIDRRKFCDTSELYYYLKNISKDEHQKYIENIQNFLKSEKAKFFSGEYYSDLFVEAVLSI